MSRARLALAACAALVALAAPEAAGYALGGRTPGGRLVMNPSMGTTPRDFIAGRFSWNDVLGDAMTAWNEVGVGPQQDHEFFQVRSPLVAASTACEVDEINDIRFHFEHCGSEFGTALAITRSWLREGVVVEADILFNNGQLWDVYTGNLRQATGGRPLQDVYRVAVHELGHAMGLDHPDEAGEVVQAIMNSRVSDIDRLQPDDIAGARAIPWGTPPPPPGTSLLIVKSGSGTGTVTSSPAGIFCGTTCAAAFDPGTTVTLTATADPGSRFVGWGANTGTDCSSGRVTLVSTAQCTAVFERDAPGILVGTIGTRGVVTGSATMYGGFTLASSANVMIAVRGRSLQAQGFTPDGLDAPRLQVYDAGGANILFGPGGVAGVSSCPATSATAAHYAGRGAPLDARDACDSRTLSPGVYTFSVMPSGDPAGEMLFEVLFNAGASGSAPLETIGSRGQVSGSATMYGGFTLATPATVEIAVRGPSLQTQGITQNPLESPRLRIFDAQDADILVNQGGGAGVFACASTHPTAQRYLTRGQPLDARDACAMLGLPGGTYTFNVTPGGTDPGGEILFEVTFRGF